MKFLKKTVNCGDVSLSSVGKNVVVNGWVHRKREHGAITFINLRDRYGIVQIIVDDKASSKLKKIAQNLKFEYCIAVKGLVRRRAKDLVNPNMKTGAVEIIAQRIDILSTCELLPFQISDKKTDAKEDLRLKYRYLDLRSGAMQKHIAFRHRFVKAIRDYLSERDFFEIETPTLIRSTPEGARDFLVPSRLYEGKFYSLPQSPQLMKQLLMVSGFDRYFQIARCYRDEDARGDRQLEFTQLDLEMSFVTRDDVLRLMEGLFGYVFKKVCSIKLPSHFRRISYKDAMNTYGCDKPDLRYDVFINDFNREAELSSFDVAKNVVKEGGFVKMIVLPKSDIEYSRKFIESYGENAKVYKNNLFFYMKIENGALETGAAKFFKSQEKDIIKKYNLKDGDVLLCVADKNWKRVCAQASSIRTKIAADLNLCDPKRFEFCWIVDFPLFSYNEETSHWEAEHHMFSMPQARFIDTLEENPGEVLGDLYDLVLNGNEVASGSIRIHDIELQKKIFKVCNYSEESAQKAFGFLLEAFKYGPPPHGGIAPGIDRLCMLLCEQDSIKEVIAFPKNTFGVSPMDDSPSYVSEEQLEELHLKIVKKENDNEA